jgi:hypothetical protein
MCSWGISEKSGKFHINREYPISIIIENENIGQHYLDFLIDDSIGIKKR